MPKNVIIIGAGGQGKVIADIIEKSNDIVCGFLDDRDRIEIPELNLIGKISDIEKFRHEASFIVAIGDNSVRKKIIDLCNVKWYTAIHPSAVIANGVLIGVGTSIMANAVISSGSIIGKGVIINTAATVDHDNVINDFVHISPGVHLSGTVNVNEGTWIGTGAVVSNNITICAGCIIGAGSVVIKNIHNTGTYVGVPARGIRYENINNSKL